MTRTEIAKKKRPPVPRTIPELLEMDEKEATKLANEGKMPDFDTHFTNLLLNQPQSAPPWQILQPKNKKFRSGQRAQITAGIFADCVGRIIRATATTATVRFTLRMPMPDAPRIAGRLQWRRRQYTVPIPVSALRKIGVTK